MRVIFLALLLSFSATAEALTDAAPEADPAAIPEAAPLGFSATVDPSTVELGRPFAYEIEIQHDPAERYELPTPLSFGQAAVRSVETDRDEEDGVATTRFRIEAAIYDTLGEASLPDLLLSVRDREGLRELRIPGAPVTVSAEWEGDELADIRSPRDVYVLSWVWLYLLGGIALLIGALFWAKRWSAARRRAGGEEASQHVDPKEAALAALSALERGELLPLGRGREFYFRLSEIVRTYLAGDAAIAATELTSAELLELLRRRPIAGLSLVEFEAWTLRGDLIRFAKAAVDPDRAQADLEEARGMVLAVAASQRREGAEGEDEAVKTKGGAG